MTTSLRLEAFLCHGDKGLVRIVCVATSVVLLVQVYRSARIKHACDRVRE